MHILITGGAGFIGANFLNELVLKYPNYHFLNFDKLTYAANLNNIKVSGKTNYQFIQGDISNRQEVHQVYKEFKPDIVVNFAAESHVDQSIQSPDKFIQTNINGTFNLIDEFRQLWQGNFANKRFHQVSTDEVYGYLNQEGVFTEGNPYQPSSPYSASKAAADHIVESYWKTYRIPITITHGSNNFGPFQHDEKLIPTIIRNAVRHQPIPIYGNGENVRDWIYVADHCQAIWQVVQTGGLGQAYNVGAHQEKSNNQMVTEILKILADLTNTPFSEYQKLIRYVPDRKGHDYRYALDTHKIEQDLKWHAQSDFETALRKTIAFYVEKYK